MQGNLAVMGESQLLSMTSQSRLTSLRYLRLRGMARLAIEIRNIFNLSFHLTNVASAL